MSMIKCPECGQRISSLAGTCPHCGVAIRGNIRQCPNCGAYAMKSATTCPECNATLPPTTELSNTADTGNEAIQAEAKKPKKGKRIALTVAVTVCLCAAGAGAFLFIQHQRAVQHEEECYMKLEGLTDPEYYKQFLVDYPQSEHRDEVRQRMESLIQENKDWQAMLASVSRSTVTQFMEKYPQSSRQCICVNMLDSIDWDEAVKQETPEAIDNYLSLHPEGQHVTDAANQKNQLAMNKITAEDKSLIRGTLETFLNNGLGRQDTAAIAQCMASGMEAFCKIQHPTPSQIAAYAQSKMEKDIIGLHYQTGNEMNLRRQSLDDGSLGYAVDFTIDETMARKDATQNTSRHYRASALLDSDRRIIRISIQ